MLQFTFFCVRTRRFSSTVEDHSFVLETPLCRRPTGDEDAALQANSTRRRGLCKDCQRVSKQIGAHSDRRTARAQPSLRPSEGRSPDKNINLVVLFVIHFVAPTRDLLPQRAIKRKDVQKHGVYAIGMVVRLSSSLADVRD